MTVRDISSQLLTVFQSTDFEPVLLFKFEFDSGDLRLWNGYRDLTFASEVYTGSGLLLAVSRIEESQNLKASNLILTLSGINPSIVSIALTEDYQGRPFTLWLGALDINGVLVPEPLLVFKGEMDVMTLADDAETATVELVVENDLIILQRKKERRFNDEDQEIDFPGDRFFEFVPSIQKKKVVLE